MGQAAERGLYMIEIIREESFDSEQKRENYLRISDRSDRRILETAFT